MKAGSPNRVLFTLSLLHGATHLFTTFLQPLNHELKAFFNLTLDQDVTRIPSIYLVSYALANLAAGLFSRHFQSRTLLAFGPIFNGLCVMAMFWLRPDQYIAACVLVALGAAGGGLYHPVANLLLTRTFPENKGRALGIVGIGACVAFIVGPLLASILVHRQICTWQHICLAYGSIGVACGALALALVPTDEIIRPEAARAAKAAADQTVLAPVLLFALFLIMAMGPREMASWGLTAITQQFSAKSSATPVDPGLLLAFIFLPGLIVQPLAGKWSDTFGRERVLAVAYLGMAFSLLILPLVPGGLIALPYLLFGVAMSATVPTMEALAAERAPIHLRGMIYGLVITSAIVLGSLGPLIVGRIADAGERTLESYRNCFWALAFGCMISFALALILKPMARFAKVEQFGESRNQPLVTIAETEPVA